MTLLGDGWIKMKKLGIVLIIGFWDSTIWDGITKLFHFLFKTKCFKIKLSFYPSIQPIGCGTTGGNSK
jgi:hypothetical protein